MLEPPFYLQGQQEWRAGMPSPSRLAVYPCVGLYHLFRNRLITRYDQYDWYLLCRELPDGMYRYDGVSFDSYEVPLLRH